MEPLNIDFEKYLQHNGQNVFKMIKTKTNKYMLVDLKTNKIVATTKSEILQRIKEWGELIYDKERKTRNRKNNTKIRS